MEKTDVEKMVSEITDFVNSYSTKHVDDFTEAMSREHRTLQQSFTRLCLKWLEHCADPTYGTDGRNMMSHDVCYEIIELWERVHGTGGLLPSQMLPLI
jgi:hypothetical protein